MEQVVELYTNAALVVACNNNNCDSFIWLLIITYFQTLVCSRESKKHSSVFSIKPPNLIISQNQPPQPPHQMEVTLLLPLLHQKYRNQPKQSTITGILLAHSCGVNCQATPGGLVWCVITQQKEGQQGKGRFT